MIIEKAQIPEEETVFENGIFSSRMSIKEADIRCAAALLSGGKVTFTTKDEDNLGNKVSDGYVIGITTTRSAEDLDEYSEIVKHLMVDGGQWHRSYLDNKIAHQQTAASQERKRIRLSMGRKQ
jgi:hypothetical protein